MTRSHHKTNRFHFEPLEHRRLLTMWSIIDLGTLGYGLGSAVADINSSAQIVGVTGSAHAGKEVFRYRLLFPAYIFILASREDFYDVNREKRMWRRFKPGKGRGQPRFPVAGRCHWRLQHSLRHQRRRASRGDVEHSALAHATYWQGQTLSPNAVVGKYTFLGDVNFDGQVTGDDYTIIDSNLNTSPAPGLAWLSGDANFDGIVTGDDYTTIDSNLGLGSSNPLAPVARPFRLLELESAPKRQEELLALVESRSLTLRSVKGEY